jgi:hypothetical protein
MDMKEPVLLLASFFAGLLVGYLAAVLSFFIGELYRKVVAKPKQFMGPAIVSLIVFAGAFYFLGVVMMASWTFFIAATLAFIFGSKPMFRIPD